MIGKRRYSALKKPLVALPDVLLEEIQEMIKARGYLYRLDVIREALREYIKEFRRENPNIEVPHTTLRREQKSKK